MLGPGVVGAEVCAPASPGGVLGPKEALQPGLTVQENLSEGPGPVKGTSHRAETDEWGQTNGEATAHRTRRRPTGGRDVQPACLLDGAGLQCAQGTCTLPEASPNNPVTDGLNVEQVRGLQADRRRAGNPQPP